MPCFEDTPSYSPLYQHPFCEAGEEPGWPWTGKGLPHLRDLGAPTSHAHGPPSVVSFWVDACTGR